MSINEQKKSRAIASDSPNKETHMTHITTEPGHEGMGRHLTNCELVELLIAVQLREEFLSDECQASVKRVINGCDKSPSLFRGVNSKHTVSSDITQWMSANHSVTNVGLVTG